MRFLAWFAIALPALAVAGGQASAFMIYPDRDNPAAMVVLIENATGDRVDFRMLPKPHDALVQSVQKPGALSFRWTYAREPQEGMAFIGVDEDGYGTIQFEFWGKQLAKGDTLAAAAVLIDENGTPLHNFFAKAAMDETAPAGEHLRVVLSVERPPAWWQAVGGVIFFTMKYRASQGLDDAESWQAMQRAVGHVTKGAGTKQFASAAGGD